MAVNKTGRIPLPANASQDDLLFYLFEARLTPEQREYVVEQFLGNAASESLGLSFSEGGLDSVDAVDAAAGAGHPVTVAERNEEFERFLQIYGDARSLGLKVGDIASLLGVSAKKLEGFLNGVGVTRDQHLRLLRADRYGDARVKQLCLNTISGAVRDGNWKAAVALLEKLFPDEYGKRTEIVGAQTITLGSIECEQKASDAAKALRMLRASREQEVLGTVDEAVQQASVQPEALAVGAVIDQDMVVVQSEQVPEREERRPDPEELLSEAAKV